MATDKAGFWTFGESQLWYSPTAGLDATWSFGESHLEDEPTEESGLSIPVAGGISSSGVLTRMAALGRSLAGSI